MTVLQPKWNTTLQAKYRGKRQGTPVSLIVLHDTAGSGKHNDTVYLSNPMDGRGVSVDFTVERDGSVWKLNPQLREFYCYHAGRSTRHGHLRNAQINRASVGIEIVQKGNLSLQPLYPDAQLESVAVLCAWLTGHFALAPSAITTHRQIITDGSRSDPRKFPFEGKGGFWHRFWRLLGKEDKYLLAMEDSSREKPMC